MKESLCSSCQRPKAAYTCGVCKNSVCKSCAQFLDEETFSFFSVIPPELKHTHYCPSCWDTHVEPAKQTYDETIERARDMYFFFDTQKRNIKQLKRAKEKVFVEECIDRDETILRLAFKAAEQGFNAIVEAEVTSKKVRNEGYQKSVWRGSGLPADVDKEKLERVHTLRKR